MLLLEVDIDTGSGALLFFAEKLRKNPFYRGIVLIDDGTGKAGPRPLGFNKERIKELVDTVRNWTTAFPPKAKNRLASSLSRLMKGNDVEITTLGTIACNTLEIARLHNGEDQDKYIIGISESLVLAFVTDCKENPDHYGKDGAGMHIALFGTEGTIASGHYQDEIMGNPEKQKEGPLPDAVVSGIPCPNLARMIDNGPKDRQSETEFQEDIKKEIRKHILQIPDYHHVTHYAGVCTHYSILNPIVAETFKELDVNPPPTIMDHPAIFEEYRRHYLEKEILNPGEALLYPDRNIFLTTGDSEKMDKAAQRIQRLLPSDHPFRTLKIKFIHVDDALGFNTMVEYLKWVGPC